MNIANPFFIIWTSGRISARVGGWSVEEPRGLGTWRGWGVSQGCPEDEVTNSYICKFYCK